MKDTGKSHWELQTLPVNQEEASHHYHIRKGQGKITNLCDSVLYKAYISKSESCCILGEKSCLMCGCAAILGHRVNDIGQKCGRPYAVILMFK